MQTQLPIQKEELLYPSNALSNNPLLQPQLPVQTNLHPNNKSVHHIEMPILPTYHIPPIAPILPNNQTQAQDVVPIGSTPAKPTPNPPYLEKHALQEPSWILV